MFLLGEEEELIKKKERRKKQGYDGYEFENVKWNKRIVLTKLYWLGKVHD